MEYWRVRLAFASVACFGPGGLRPGPGKEDQDRRRLRPDRPVRGRRVEAAIRRRQDHARLLHQAGRGRRLQDRADLRRCPEQARRRDQRGGAADRAGKSRHGDGLLLLGAVRAGGGEDRDAEEVHVDHHLHLERGAREPAPALRLPAAGQRQPVRRAGDRHDRRILEVQVRQGSQGPAGRDRARGRRLRRRRRQGRRGGLQEARLQDRAERRLLDHRARPVGAGHQAEARQAGRDLPYRLQSRHHAAAAPGARAGAEGRRDRRPGRGLQRLRQAEGGVGQGFQLPLHHRSDLDLADQSQDAGSQAAAADQDGRRGVRQDGAGRDAVGACRHVRQQHLRVLHAGAAGARSRSTAASTARRCARRRSTSTSPKAAR